MSIKFKKDDVIQNTVYDVYENYDESKSTVEDIILPERDKDKDPRRRVHHRYRPHRDRRHHRT